MAFLINVIKWLLWTVQAMYFDAVGPVFYIYSTWTVQAMYFDAVGPVFYIYSTLNRL